MTVKAEPMLHPSVYKQRKRAFYGLAVGDRVLVNGEGSGVIVEMGQAEWPLDDRIVVAIARREYHERSGQTIEWTDLLTRHPRHMSRCRP